MQPKRSITVKQSKNSHYKPNEKGPMKETEFNYTVQKAVNSTTPTIGAILNGNAVQQLIRDGYTVTVL